MKKHPRTVLVEKKREFDRILLQALVAIDTYEQSGNVVQFQAVLDQMNEFRDRFRVQFYKDAA